jgi:serine/threonine-protein kinase
MADVTLALHRGEFGFSVPVAVKRLLPQFVSDPTFVDMFVDEARLLARLKHPNVVAARDLRRIGDEPLLVLEYIEGVSASQLVKAFAARDEPVPIEFVTQIVTDGLHALAHAHALRADDGTHERVIHRDVSPQNLLVGLDGQTKLIDFGVARAENRLVQTRSATLKGKFAYMAPEQLGTEYDHRVDLFAMGVVLFELLTSTRLFRGRDEREILGAVIACEVPDVLALRKDCPPDLAHVVRTALERDPDARPPSAEAMAAAIENAAATRGVRARLGAAVESVGEATIRQRRSLVQERQQSTSTATLPSATDSDATMPSVPSHLTPVTPVALDRMPTPAPERQPSWRAPVLVAALTALVTWGLTRATTREQVTLEQSLPDRGETPPAVVEHVVRSAPQDTSPRRVSATFRTSHPGLFVRVRDSSCSAPCVLHVEASEGTESAVVRDLGGETRRFDVSLRDDVVVDLDTILTPSPPLARDAPPPAIAPPQRSRRVQVSMVRDRVGEPETPEERFPTFD